MPLVIAGEEMLADRRHAPLARPLPARSGRRALPPGDGRRRSTAPSHAPPTDPDGWRRRTPRERTETLFRAADELARNRGDLLGAMLAEGGKLLTEGDPEVSEAIDFCRFYAQAAEEFYALPSLTVGAQFAVGPRLTAKPRGVVVVVSPWNFPLAIPCGGVAAALAAGNTVILKPASDTVLIAYLLCQCFWRAGVPRTALQFAPCSGATRASSLSRTTRSTP